jgi:hypothetical protein
MITIMNVYDVFCIWCRLFEGSDTSISDWESLFKSFNRHQNSAELFRCVSNTASSHLANIVSVFDISHSKSPIPGTGSGAQTSKTCQHQQTKTYDMYIFFIRFISY